MRFLFMTMCVAAVAAHAQYSGRVIGFDSSAVAGASVTQPCAGVMDTTDTDGVYELASVSIRRPNSRYGSSATVGFAENEVVYALNGQRISGTRYAQSADGTGLFLQTARDRSLATVAAVSENRAGAGNAASLTAVSTRILACSFDSLIVSLNGYLEVIRMVNYSQAPAEIVLHRLGRHDISVAEAYRLTRLSQSDPAYTVIDIRTASEFNGGHIAGAINIDYYSASFASALAALPRDRPYLVYCQSSARSSASMATFASLGFASYYNMLGGMSAWRTAGYPTAM